ncbi:MAG TPA: RecQ family ATP-dependent DNA helicase [Acidimicrobiales bacterium]|nr:RecQ family ATP-dependent DNA helicase [Acidimicrobiales bacterium]
MAEPLHQVLRLARERFGFDDLRPGQAEAIESVLAGRDTLAVLPTGSGKSAIYQLPALLLDGPTLIVSPLIALQRDQVENLLDGPGLKAAQANSAIGASARRSALERVASGDLEFLFLAPEQLRKDDVIEAIQAAKPSLFVVDEAHCISGWGHDFRPDYLLLDAVIEQLGRPTVLALTATASPPVRAEIVERLGMRDPTVVVRGFDRPNIHLDVEAFLEERHKRKAMIERCLDTPGPGLVYAATRKQTEELAADLSAAGLRSAAYHAGMAAQNRERVHEAFVNDELDVVVATTAFGMGIDKPNVRYVFHYAISESLDSYYQEIGRAGRDGEPAHAVLFFRNEDLGLRRFFAGGAELGAHQLLGVAVTVARSDGPVELTELAERTGLSQTKLTTAVSRLEEAGAVELLPGGEVVAVEGGAHPVDAAEEAARNEEARVRVEQSRVEMIRGYAEARSCRREYLLNYFGEQVGGACGNCDNCTKAGDEGVAADDLVVPFAQDQRVVHREWGEGLLVRADADTITVLFDDVGYKTLSLRLLMEHDLLRAV